MNAEPKQEIIEVDPVDNAGAVPAEYNVSPPVAANQTPLTPMAMIAQAAANGASTEVLDKLMDLRDREEAHQARKAFENALADAKQSIPPIIKGREVDYTHNGKRTNYRHEDLAGIARVVDPILAEHGLSYRYRTDVADGMIWVTCILAHRDGHSEETKLPGSRDESGGKNTIQGLGSTVTYLQRYTLKAALGLSSSHDDDAQSAEEEVDNPISEDRVAHIRKEMAELGIDEARFTEHLGIPNLMEMPESKFGDACQALDRKRRHNQAKAAEEGDQS